MSESKKRKKRERLHEKRCAFVDLDGKRCKTVFFGIGKAKFCKVHRQPKYRKIIDRDKILAKKKSIIENTANFTMKHKHTQAVEINRRCDACNEEYTLMLYPSIYIYPKFCPAHRNEWKRKYYLAKKNKCKGNSK